MPLYEYRCLACGKTFEDLTFFEAKEVRCPHCGGRTHKLMSPFSIRVPDELCGKLPRGEERELCTECRRGGGACPAA